MIKNILKREQISAQLKNIFDYRLTVVVAAMGYGKTTSVKDYLDEVKAKYIWLFVESDEASAQYIWDSFTRQLAKIDPEFGNRLNTSDFPIDAPQRDRVINIVADYVSADNIILVIDDYHNANSPELDRLIERMVRADIGGLHIVLISRIKPEINIDELQLKGYCYLIKSNLFELSKEEIKEYFKLFGHDISSDTAEEVHRFSEGWITAVYLIIQRYCETGELKPDRNLESLLKTAVMSRYTPVEVKILLALSFLDDFTLQQAAYVADDPAAAETIQRLSIDDFLIRHDERTGTYKMHNIFRSFFQKLLEERPGELQLRDIHKRSGEWYIAVGNVLLGLKAFLKAEEYDLILAEFEKPGITKILDRYPRLFLELFEQIPAEVKYRRPIGYLTYVDYYITDVDMKGGATLLAQIEQYYQADSATPPELKRRIFGEIELIRSLLFFNDLRKMHECYFKAYQLLNGSSVIANKDMIFTFGSPHTLYLYHREKGDMWWIVEYINQLFHLYRYLSNGCGTGFEYQLKAEYYLETGDYDQAELFAGKAIYQAETMEQFSIIICANLTLARIYAAQGKYSEALDLLNDLKADAKEYNSPILRNSVELCAGYIGGIFGEPDSFAGWLKSGDMRQSQILFQGMAFNYIIYAKSLLLEENYLKLAVLCDQMQELFSMFNNLFGYLHLHILNAVAQYKLYGMDKAKAELAQALELGKADGIILPFAEYGLYILDILKTLQEESGDNAYLDRLIKETSRYAANLKLFTGMKKGSGDLTNREREILRLVAEGQTNREIAAKFFIAEITVRKNITSIYRKLEVSGRAAAVKKAVELKLT
jgi:LuxR family maltose regulon positive regulatory protein